MNKKIITLDTTVDQFLSILNEALKVLAGRGFRNASKLHSMVEEIIVPLLPKELEYSTWYIRGSDIHSDGSKIPFCLKHEIKQDKRVVMGLTGKIIRLWYVQQIEGITIGNIIAEQKRLIKIEQIEYIKKEILEKEISLKKLKEDLFDLTD